MKRGTDELSDRISKTEGNRLERRQEANRIALSDVRRYRREGLVSASMLPLTKMAEDEARALFQIEAVVLTIGEDGES